MVKQLLVAMLLGGLALGLRAQTYPVEVLQGAGPVGNRVNFVILGDGYRSQDQALLTSDARKVLTTLWNTAPFNQYRQCFNVKLVHVVSPDNGADQGSYGSSRSTALDATFGASGIDRLLVVNSTKAISIAQAHVPEYDYLIVVVNDPKYGGSGGQICVFSTHASSVEVFLHELGHSFGGLADEYATPYPGYPPCGVECPEPNATPKRVREQIKWRAWIDASTPVPTSSSYASAVGLFEGARYQSSGLFRPKYRCRMQILGEPFCEVCREALVWSVYDAMDPIDAASPSSPVVADTQPVTLTVATPTLSPSSFQITWKVDGVVKATSGTSLTLQPGELGTGTHTVLAEVQDLTPTVRNDPNQLLKGMASWTVHVSGNPQPLALQAVPQNQTASAGSTVRFTVVAKGGTPPYHYLWLKGGVPLGVPDLATLTLNSVQGSDAGAYAVEVTDSSQPLQKVTTGPATLSVQSARDLAVNGTFEQGTTGWAGTTGAIGNWSTYAHPEPAYAGTRCAYLGGYGKAVNETLYQTLTIPSQASAATLALYLHIDTAETGATAYDTLAVQVRNASGVVLKTLGTFSNLQAAVGYKRVQYDLLAFRGQTIQIAVNVKEDSMLQTSFTLDNVSVIVN